MRVPLPSASGRNATRGVPYAGLPSSELVRRACPGMRVVAVATHPDPRPRPRHALGTSGLQFCREMAWTSLLGQSADGSRSERKRPR